MKTNMMEWKDGVKNGMPIFFGYFAVAFTFGILAKQVGVNPFEAFFMSATNLTSAGQFAGLSLIASAALFMEIAMTQLIINSRYFLMSFSLSQKIDHDTSTFHRLVMAHGITDEIFGISIARKGKLSPYFVYGAMTVAIPGWAFGTVLGVISGNILPPRLISALSIALYGMLIAVIIPPAKGSKIIAALIVVSMSVSLVFSLIPLFSVISSGVKIILLTIVIAGAAAFLFPLKEENES